MCLFCDVCDHSRALRLARRSAAAGSVYGQFALGYAHQYGYGGADEDYDQALLEYAPAALQGLAEAQCVATPLRDARCVMERSGT